MDNKKMRLLGHGSALVTVLIWATTFISTKVLLRDFAPMEILLFRFMMGYIALISIHPRPLKTQSRRDELLFVAAGICGVTFYFLLENVALTLTLASNVGVIATVAPFFIAVLAHFLLQGEALRPRFFVGFLIAISGVVLIVFNGTVVLDLYPLGDFLALCAPVVWAVYSVLMRILFQKGYQTVESTRRVFFYGLLFMIPILCFLDFAPTVEKLTKPINIANLVYLGLGASALCFVSWNRAVSILGAVKTSVYIYTVPMITITASAVILREPITWMALLGAALTISGLVVSEWKRKPAPVEEAG